MALSVGELVAYLRLDKGGYDQGLQQSEQQTGRFRGVLSRVTPVAVAVSAGIAAVGAAAWGAATATARHGDHVAKTARELGVSSDAYQELEYALGQYGLEQSEVDQTLSRFNRTLGDAATGSGTAGDTFDELGVKVRDANGDIRDTDDVLMDTIQSLSEIEDPAVRASRAQELFGRAGRKLLPALEDGSNGIGELRDRAQELGIVLDKDALDASETFTDALDDFKRSSQGAMHSIGAALLPILTDLFGLVQERVVPAIQDGAETVAEWIEKFGDLPGPVKGALGGLGGLLAALGPILLVGGKVIGWITKFATAFRALSLLLFANPIGIVVGLLAALAFGLYKAYQNSETFREIVSSAFAAVRGAWEWLWDEALQPGLEGLQRLWSEIWPDIRDAGREAFDHIREGAEEFWAAIQPHLDELIVWAEEKAPEFRDKVREAFDSILDWWDENGEEVTRNIVETGELISEFLNDVADWWDEHGEKIVETIKEMWSRAREQIGGALDIIQGIFRIFGGVVSGDWSQLWGGLQQTMHGAFRVINGLLGGWPGRVQQMMSAARARVISAARSAGQWLYNAGRRIVSGLLNGITSKFGSIGSTMSGLASRVRSYLPFSPAKRGPLSGSGSPDRAGATIVSMLADGLGDTREVDDAMGRLAGAMSRPVPAEVRAYGSRRSRHGLGGEPGMDDAGWRRNDLGAAVHIDRFEATEHMSPDDVGEALYALVTARG